jgi:hypothetical protein
MRLTGYATDIGNSKPNLIDITNETIIYEGYLSGRNYIICKIDMSTPIISRTWASGSWANRASLQYS